MCRKCDRNLLLEYATEFVCLACEFVVEKTKIQLTKLQRKQNTNFTTRLSYAKPKIISICMEVDSLTSSNNDFDLLASALTYLNRILPNFDKISEDFETNSLSRNSNGIQKAGNDAIRMLKWMISDDYYVNINSNDLIATALKAMKGVKLTVSQQTFFQINNKENDLK